MRMVHDCGIVKGETSRKMQGKLFTTLCVIAFVALQTSVVQFSFAKQYPALSNVRIEAVSPIQEFTLTEWTVPTATAQPYGIGVDPNGIVWFTENGANKLASFDQTDNDFTEWDLPTPNSQPHNLFVNTVTLAGILVSDIFFTEYASDKIARRSIDY